MLFNEHQNHDFTHAYMTDVDALIRASEPLIFPATITIQVQEHIKQFKCRRVGYLRFVQRDTYLRYTPNTFCNQANHHGSAIHHKR